MRLPISRLRLGRVESRGARIIRPANLIDYAIGFAVFAIGLRLSIDQDFFKAPHYPRGWYTGADLFTLLNLWLRRAIAMLIPLTLGYMLVRLRGRRPPSPRMARHPGFVAATVATAAIMLGLALNLAKLLAGKRIRPDGYPWVEDFYPSVGYVVLGSWLALMFTGRWRRDRLWLEVPGIILGFAWIATALAEWVGLGLHLELFRG